MGAMRLYPAYQLTKGRKTMEFQGLVTAHVAVINDKTGHTSLVRVVGAPGQLHLPLDEVLKRASQIVADELPGYRVATVEEFKEGLS